MPNLRFLPSIRDSETVTCQRCNTRQFPRNGVCVRCRQPLELDYVSLRIDALLNTNLEASKEHLAQVIGPLLRNLRKRRGLCQSQLATRAAGSVTRASLSKQECSHILLSLDKLLWIAKALGLTAVILRFESPANRSAHDSINRR